MKFDTHGNGHGLDDLYVLPENARELKYVLSYLQEIGRSYKRVRSDVKGHAWYGKEFIDIPFGQTLRYRIAQLSDASVGL